MEENNELNQGKNDEIQPSDNNMGEFWKGFGIGFLFLLIPIVTAMFGLSNSFSFVAIFSLVIYLSVIIFFVVKRRWRFVLGLVTSVLIIPLAIFGGCLLIIMR